jgi:uncharacterized RDD family membrane protein YckC
MSKGQSVYLAFTLDFLIVSTCMTLFGTLLFGLAYMLPSLVANWIVLPIWIALDIVMLLGYWPYFMIARKGYTPGRALVGFPKP